MGRSVVLKGTVRCPQCQIAPRWCICAGARTVALPFGVEVLMHNAEAWKPTSTGNLIARVVPGSRKHIYHNQRLPQRADVCGDTLRHSTWILHPRGDTLDDVMRSEQAPKTLADLRVVLIDGTWSQANDMLRHAEGWGQRVNLPMHGESRYRLRTQYRAGHFSTIEALMFLTEALGLNREHATLREQFELHVYASLLARGHKTDAAAYLAESPIQTVHSDLVAHLTTKPPKTSA